MKNLSWTVFHKVDKVAPNSKHFANILEGLRRPSPRATKDQVAVIMFVKI